MDKAITQARKVAEAARRYRDHQRNIEFGRRSGDVHRQNYDNQTEALLIELDRAIARWKIVDELSDNTYDRDGSILRRLFRHRRPRPVSPAKAQTMWDKTAIDESQSIKRVAKVACALRDHQFSLFSLLESGEYNGEEFYKETQELLWLLDMELAAWKRFDSTTK